MKKLEDFFINKYLASQPLRGSQHSAVNHLVDAVSTSMERTSSPEAFLNNLFTALKSSPGPHPSDQDTDLDDTPASQSSAQDTDLDTDTPPTDVHDADLDSVIPPPSSEHDSSIITTHEMQDEVTPSQDPPLIEEQPQPPVSEPPPPQDPPLIKEQPPVPEHPEPQPPVSEPPPPASPSSLPYLKTSDCERLYASMVTYKFSQNSYDNTVFEVLRAPNSSHKFCMVKIFDIDDTHILPLHPKLTAKPTKHKNALGIQWEDDMMNQERLSTKYKTSIWLKNKSQRDQLLKVLTDAMSACARTSPELYRNVHKNICDDRLPRKSP